jgi:competence protein ComGC
MNKNFLIPALVLCLGGGLLYGATRVSAFSMGVNSSSPIVQKLVEKFDLNANEVVTTFNELREEHRTQMRAEREERLNQAVADGVITEEQKQALIQKQEEMQAEMEQHREEMDAWFEKQGIDRDALSNYGGFGGPKGMKGIHRFGK